VDVGCVCVCGGVVPRVALVLWFACGLLGTKEVKAVARSGGSRRHRPLALGAMDNAGCRVLAQGTSTGVGFKARALRICALAPGDTRSPQPSKGRHHRDSCCFSLVCHS
jgi:hypothetical protein